MAAPTARLGFAATLSCSLEAMESVKAQHSVGALDLEAMKSVDALVSVNVLDSDVAMESIDVVPDSVDVVVPDSVDVVVPDSVELVSDSVDVVPDFVEDVPDDDEVVHCPRCGTLHAGGVFGDACFQARRNARRQVCTLWPST